MESQDVNISMHPLFNDPSADVVVESSDKIRFRLHRKNIQVHTGSTFLVGLYNSSINDPKVACLPEPVNVLETVFQFLYPRKHPNLGTIPEFENVAAIAEAVGKYGIYGAMNACEIRLKSFLPNHAIEIFAYAFKYHNQELLNEAAPILACLSLHEGLQNLPPQCHLPWVKYRKAWSDVFDAIRAYINTLRPRTDQVPADGYDKCLCYDTYPIYRGVICANCHDFLMVWAHSLEKILDLAELKSKITNSLQNVPARQGLTNGCPNLRMVATYSQGLIEAMPSFASFVHFES